jgi:hypothetical protein
VTLKLQLIGKDVAAKLTLDLNHGLTNAMFSSHVFLKVRDGLVGFLAQNADESFQTPVRSFLQSANTARHEFLGIRALARSASVARAFVHHQLYRKMVVVAHIVEHGSVKLDGDQRCAVVRVVVDVEVGAAEVLVVVLFHFLFIVVFPFRAIG